MQRNSWNDLRYLLALRRGGTVAAAARILGVNTTTVSRRLAVLHAALDVDLYLRQRDGSLQLTQVGEAIADRAEVMEQQIEGIDDLLSQQKDLLVGTVRITAVPMVVNRLLVPRLADLLARHPELKLELVPDSRDLNLVYREADLAIRLARPGVGGTSVKARRIAMFGYAVYAATGFQEKDAQALPWIIYDDTMAHLPQAKWLSRVSAMAGESIFGLRVLDAETAIEAVLSGHGKTLLPRIIGDLDTRLIRLTSPGEIPVPEREVWLLSHAHQSGLRHIKAAMNWIETTMIPAR